MKVQIELVVVDGPEGEYLRQRQDEAIREALRWFAEHPQQRSDPDSLNTTPAEHDLS